MKCSECGMNFREENAVKHVDRHADDCTFCETTYVSPCCKEAFDTHCGDDEYDYCPECGLIDGCECDKRTYSRLDLADIFDKTYGGD